jgi:hypothetical protein
MAVRMKTTTVQMNDGKRVSWFNTSYVKITEVDAGYELKIYWKYKASIKSETIETTMSSREMLKYFNRFGLVPLEDYYINLSRIMFIDEEVIYGAIEKSRVHMVFTDGLEITKIVKAQDWSWWKQSYM